MGPDADEEQEEALTLAQAAQRLGVQPQRISQMLNKGDLTGPDLPPGRAPKNVGRVWVSSVVAELKRRRLDHPAGGGLAGRVRLLEAKLAELEAADLRRGPSSGSDGSHSQARERAALAVAATLKVSLEVATQSLLSEQQVSAGLRRENAALRESLDLAEQRAHTLDALAKTFGESLTQLLGPDSPDFI
ncbi:hypothetical protein [Nocardioides rubriscoriae]|uniref:hypothetical protein n=1 Tax=Nocardioides rubriscoriae TaxID=642762 RepID=UPI0011DFDE5E|nr:hypothetical protein [Nocardioides rubriscoriae]